MDFTIQQIEEITKNFSEEQKIGKGGYGEVYKGVHNGMEIAVKKLFNDKGLDDNEFKNECLNLVQVQHQHIVQLVGYCYETRNKHIEHNGEYVFARVTERVLCLEYMHGGSLASLISDESSGLDWSARYKIIKGTCEGLNYLHNRPRGHIYHLDLKPDNILLDKNMMPKIADFGLSRLFPSSKTHITSSFKGTLGYMPPEYIERRRITKKFDVFSLGVIILQVIAGPMGFNIYSEMSASKFMEMVLERWKKRLQATSKFKAHKVEMLAISRCIEIALRCVQSEEKRSTTLEIVNDLKLLEDELKISQEPANNQRSQIPMTSRGFKDIGADPAHELRFPFELNKEISCCMQLTNQTDDFVAFILRINQKKYRTHPNKGIMEPWSKCYIIITMQARKVAPENMQCLDVLLVQSTRVSGELTSNEIDEDLFKTTEDKVVDEEKFPIVYVALTQASS